LFNPLLTHCFETREIDKWVYLVYSTKHTLVIFKKIKNQVYLYISIYRVCILLSRQSVRVEKACDTKPKRFLRSTQKPGRASLRKKNRKLARQGRKLRAGKKGWKLREERKTAFRNRNRRPEK
jgi:hypothetical protein